MAFCVHPSWLSLPPLLCLSVSERWGTVAIFRFTYRSLAPAQISPVFTLQLHLDCRNMESTHYSEVKAVRQRDAEEKDVWKERMDGWGTGLAPIPALDLLLSWQRHVWPYLPPHTPLSVRAPCSRPCAFLLPHTFPSFFSAWGPNLFWLCPFSLALCLQVWPPRWAGERVKSERSQLLPRWWATFALFFGQVAKRKGSLRLSDCSLCPFILCTVISYLLEKLLESLFLDQNGPHMESVHDGAAT